MSTRVNHRLDSKGHSGLHDIASSLSTNMKNLRGLVELPPQSVSRVLTNDPVSPINTTNIFLNGETNIPDPIAWFDLPNAGHKRFSRDPHEFAGVRRARPLPPNEIHSARITMKPVLV